MRQERKKKERGRQNIEHKGRHRKEERKGKQRVYRERGMCGKRKKIEETENRI